MKRTWQFDRTTHGKTDSKEHRAWRNMKTRCSNPNGPWRTRYVGRGISVCAKWRNSFTAFLKDVGPAPSPRHSLDRIDNNGNYEPGNVRWATRLQQARNNANVRPLTFAGTTMTKVEWAESPMCKCSYRAFLQRILAGWDMKRALTTPSAPLHAKPSLR